VRPEGATTQHYVVADGSRVAGRATEKAIVPVANSGCFAVHEPVADLHTLRETAIMRFKISTVGKIGLVMVAMPFVVIAALLSAIFDLKAKLSADEVAANLRHFIEGSDDDCEWDEFTSVPIANPELEYIRRRAAAVDLSLTAAGLVTLHRLLAEAEHLANLAQAT
jgi:hypothetical protein